MDTKFSLSKSRPMLRRLWTDWQLAGYATEVTYSPLAGYKARIIAPDRSHGDVVGRHSNSEEYAKANAVARANEVWPLL